MSDHNTFRIVRECDKEVKVGNVCAARYCHSDDVHYWLATFAPAPLAASGYVSESAALHALVEQLQSDVDAIRRLAEKLAREGR